MNSQSTSVSMNSNSNPFEMSNFYFLFKESTTSIKTSSVPHSRVDSNYNAPRGPETKIEKNVLDKLDSVPSQRRNSKSDNKNKKDCLIF